MLADQVARATVRGHVLVSPAVELGIQEFSRLEFPREDLAWLMTQVRVARRSKPSKVSDRLTALRDRVNRWWVGTEG